MSPVTGTIGSIAKSLVVFLLAGATMAHADSGLDFYKGKVVNYVAATAPGGGYDYYARLVAPIMEKQLPGSTFVIRNMPGAGHLIGANYIANSKPDGLTIGIFNTGLIYNQLIKLNGVKFDLGKMSWIGKAASDPRILIVAEHTGIKTFEDMRNAKKTLKFGIGGIGSSGYVEMVILKNAYNLPMQIVTGYQGAADLLAMRRGELDGTLGGFSSVRSFAESGYGRMIGQIGGSEKIAPQLGTFTSDPRTQRLLSLIQSQAEIGRLTVGPAKIPADRLEALRTAYRKTLESKDIQEKVAKSGRPLDPAYGEDVANAVRAALNQTPDTIALLKEAMEAGKNEKLPEFNGTITSLGDSNKNVVMKLTDGTEFKTAISGSRTRIMMAGKDVKRSALTVGASCTITAPKNDAEAKLIDCK